MTRFAYVADTHVGTARIGYTQQPGYPQRLGEIVEALKAWLVAHEVDFLLHGGDMLNAATEANIAAAGELFDIGVPVYLCLGNHDLTEVDALEWWLAQAPQFFIGGAPEYTIETDDCVIHVAPNHWCDVPYFWKQEQRPHLSAAQVAELRRGLRERPEVPHILSTHSAALGLPEAQTGLDAPYHGPDPAFSAQLLELARESASLACVLGAHTHLNMRVPTEGVEMVTVSSLAEAPFDVKLFEVSATAVQMSTHSLREAVPFASDYDASCSFVQGRPVDRAFVRPWPRRG